MDKNGSIGQKAYQVYLMSLERLKQHDPDLVDEIVVALWRHSEVLQVKNTELNKLVSEQQMTINSLNHQLDYTQSKLLSVVQMELKSDKWGGDDKEHLLNIEKDTVEKSDVGNLPIVKGMLDRIFKREGAK
jgi:hypothetical protein